MVFVKLVVKQKEFSYLQFFLIFYYIVLSFQFPIQFKTHFIPMQNENKNENEKKTNKIRKHKKLLYPYYDDTKIIKL